MELERAKEVRRISEPGHHGDVFTTWDTQELQLNCSVFFKLHDLKNLSLAKLCTGLQYRR
jgi:hypothetical protein